MSGVIRLFLLMVVVMFQPVFSAHAGGVRGMEHVGITVPDLQEAKEFFTEKLGCQEAFQLGPFADPEGSWMSQNVGTHDKATLKISALKCGNATNVELFEFASPDQVANWPKREDYGATSLGFYVDDLKSFVDELKSKNVEVLGDIKLVDQGPIAGRSWVYAKAPWGMLIFLMSEPEGIAYEKQPDALHLFSPRDLPE
ncbi:VOC family protein [Kiloniella laminariae]|uniref:VOC family protein n=1 Tax=Kiloniella laminariae TaxID=454162 RepID=A0ABT4LMF3_9PROT|nr:VOC family protein [Kiloniella laminariae]MCZ4282308.1 VOC family protein [Kiloniella laminariae]